MLQQLFGVVLLVNTALLILMLLRQGEAMKGVNRLKTAVLALVAAQATAVSAMTETAARLKEEGEEDFNDLAQSLEDAASGLTRATEGLHPAVAVVESHAAGQGEPTVQQDTSGGAGQPVSSDGALTGAGGEGTGAETGGTSFAGGAGQAVAGSGGNTASTIGGQPSSEEEGADTGSDTSASDTGGSEG
jgi:hypothetical protein